MVQNRLGGKWSGFWMGSEIRKPSHLKYGQMATNLSKNFWNPDKNARILNSLIVECLRLKLCHTWLFKNWTIWNPTFKMSGFQIFLDFKWSDFRSPLCYIITWYYPFDLLYSGDLKSNHSKSGNIWNVDFLKMVQILNGQGIVVIAKAMVLPIWKLDHYKSEIFCLDFNFFTEWWPFV